LLRGKPAPAHAPGGTIAQKPNSEAFSRLFDEDECSQRCTLAEALRSERRRKIMTGKCVLAVGLITPLLTLPSMAQQYHGGPKSSVAPTTQQISSGADIYTQGVAGEIYAQGVRGDVYVSGVGADRSPTYRGGPKTTIPGN
jgi:hypothetical protein